MIYVGIDDTDVVGSPGTNQLAKILVESLRGKFACPLILRHQLLFDPRVPYTSKNSSATLLLEPHGEANMMELMERVTDFIETNSAHGSDPGVCVTTFVPDEVQDFGRRCQTDLVTQDEARSMARDYGLCLLGLGGTQDGVIGALAAVGLAASQNDGRVVMIDNRDDLCGVVPVSELLQKDIRIRCEDLDSNIQDGFVDLGKHLRPNRCQGQVTLFVTPGGHAQAGLATSPWLAVRRP